MKFTGTKMPASGEQKSEESWYLEDVKGGTFMIKRTYYNLDFKFCCGIDDSFLVWMEEETSVWNEAYSSNLKDHHYLLLIFRISNKLNDL